MESVAVKYNLHVQLAEIEKICKKHYIKKLSIFGSALHGDARPDSDLDILVEFETGHVPGFAIVDIEEQLSTLFGRKVDLRTPYELSKYFRASVVSEAQAIYGG